MQKRRIDVIFGFNESKFSKSCNDMIPNKKLNHLLLFFGFFCLALSLIRVKLTTSIILMFLIWNLFLAVIPFIITSY